MKHEDNYATIETLGDDQGGGASFCSNCNNNLTRYLTDISKKQGELECPKCHFKLRYGSITPYTFGGSDFYG